LPSTVRISPRTISRKDTKILELQGFLKDFYLILKDFASPNVKHFLRSNHKIWTASCLAVTRSVAKKARKPHFTCALSKILEFPYLRIVKTSDRLTAFQTHFFA